MFLTRFTEMALTIDTLPVFFKQRDNLFYPAVRKICFKVLRTACSWLVCDTSQWKPYYGKDARAEYL